MPSIIHVSNIPVETLPGKSVRGYFCVALLHSLTGNAGCTREAGDAESLW